MYSFSLIMLFSGCKKKSEESGQIYEEYHHGVVMVRSRYVYSVDFNNGFRLFFVPGDRDEPPAIGRRLEHVPGVRVGRMAGFKNDLQNRISSAHETETRIMKLYDPGYRRMDVICGVQWPAADNS